MVKHSLSLIVGSLGKRCIPGIVYCTPLLFEMEKVMKHVGHFFPILWNLEHPIFKPMGVSINRGTLKSSILDPDFPL